ncbi:hypothetical protein FOA52_013514 [Chlamydomonas sp. UWO 241]|nr:hypothetical protein FOA52_013514 [Chlamydomonas sp. UWO 241]
MSTIDVEAEMEVVCTRVLQEVFSLSSFRAGQLEACKATLSGRDSILILPTGAGKSLTFMLPPLTVPHGFTVVISPLLALAKDQVEAALELGIDTVYFNSAASDQQKNSAIREVSDPETSLKLLYTTPESLANPRLHAALREAYDAGTIISFAVDEAHCVSEWGHDFRPAYLQLGHLRDVFTRTPIACLTATCTAEVQRNVQSVLALRSPCLVKASFNRVELAYSVRYKELFGDGSEDGVLQDLIEFVRAREGQTGIVYARLRKTVDSVSKALECAELDAAPYHAGMDTMARARVQRNWSCGDTKVVVATVAFGMGINMATVRWVVHFNAPNSVEGFYQESGRGGRDGQPCESVVYASKADIQEMSRLEKASRRGAVDAVDKLLMAPGCRRKKLLQFFGERREACGAVAGEMLCDFCTDPEGVNRRLHVRHAPPQPQRSQLSASQAPSYPSKRACQWQPANSMGEGGTSLLPERQPEPLASTSRACSAPLPPLLAGAPRSWLPASLSAQAPAPGVQQPLPQAPPAKPVLAKRRSQGLGSAQPPSDKENAEPWATRAAGFAHIDSGMLDAAEPAAAATAAAAPAGQAGAAGSSSKPSQPLIAPPVRPSKLSGSSLISTQVRTQGLRRKFAPPLASQLAP